MCNEMKIDCLSYLFVGPQPNDFVVSLRIEAQWALAADTAFIREPRTQARALEEVGARLIDNNPCLLFRCSDAKVRAVPMAAIENRMRGQSL